MKESKIKRETREISVRKHGLLVHEFRQQLAFPKYRDYTNEHRNGRARARLRRRRFRQSPSTGLRYNYKLITEDLSDIIARFTASSLWAPLGMIKIVRARERTLARNNVAKERAE